MRTSPTQFDILMTFMEQHGDLSKPTTNAKGRIRAIRRWEDLICLLNNDPSGDSKTPEKWKKVWSDFKNNTKRKAAKITKAATGTGGGPAVYTKLTDVEQRVLALIGVQAATGLKGIEEAGLLQETHSAVQQSTPVSPPPIAEETFYAPIYELTQVEEECNESFSQPGSSSMPHIAPPPSSQIISVPSITFGHVQPSQGAADEITGGMVITNTPPDRQQPARLGQTPTRRSPRPRIRASSRRLMRSSNMEQAAQHFINSDADWREFKIEQQRENAAIKREQLRVREMELQTQREWQALGMRALDILEKLVDKYKST